MNTNEIIEKANLIFIDEFEVDEDDLAYRIARREAHRADNALVMTWRNMQLDPRKQQQLKEQVFILTYLNHALLSYLSALGAHRNQFQLEANKTIFFSKHILNALEESCEWLLSNECNNLVNIKDVLEKTSIELLSTNHENISLLLYNISEVTLQILEQAKLFQQKK